MENIYAIDRDASEDQPGSGRNRIRLGRRLDGESLGARLHALEAEVGNFEGA